MYLKCTECSKDVSFTMSGKCDRCASSFLSACLGADAGQVDKAPFATTEDGRPIDISPEGELVIREAVVSPRSSDAGLDLAINTLQAYELELETEGLAHEDAGNIIDSENVQRILVGVRCSISWLRHKSSESNTDEG